MTEGDLIRKAQSGDQTAFKELVYLYSALTRRTAAAFLGNRPEAEDAVQEAWLDAWRALDRFDPERAFRPWILTLLVNRCRMAARKRDLVTVPYTPDLYEAAGSRSAGPLIAGRSSDQVLRDALSGLSGDERRVVALRFYADLSLEEIAATLDAPLGTVKSRLHRALAKLRASLSAQNKIVKSEEKGVIR